MSDIIVKQQEQQKDEEEDEDEEEIKGNQKQKLNSTNKLIIIYGIASGMSYLYANDIHNPELNPRNIIIDKNIQPKLTNYGFEFISHSTSYYSSHEIKESQNIPEMWDYYS